VQQPAAAYPDNTPALQQRTDIRTGMTITAPTDAAAIDAQWAALGVAAGNRPAYAPSMGFNDPLGNANTLAIAQRNAPGSTATKQLEQSYVEAAKNAQFIEATWSRPVTPDSSMSTREGINAVVSRQTGGTFGDSKSEAIATGLQDLALFGGAPAIYANRDTADLTGLEVMRQQSVQAGNNRGSAFYGNEERRQAESYVDIASAYHHFGQDINQPIGPNPYEYRGDLAVEFIKGQPINSQYQFSPVSGEMSAQLPQVNERGYGLQDWQWAQAKGNAPSVDFMQSVQYLGGATGQYGPYGALAGQKESPTYATLTWEGGLSPEQARALPAPFLSTLPSDQGTMPTATPFVSTMQAGDKSPSFWEQLVRSPVLIGNAGGFGAMAASDEGVNGVTYANGQPIVQPSAGPSSYFEGVSNWFRDAPILGAFYAAGKNTPQGGLIEAVKTMPVLSSIYQGGGVFEMKSDYEMVAERTDKTIAPLITKYQSDLSGYNADVTTYNKNPTEAGFISLQSRGQALAVQQGDIQSYLNPTSDLKARYEKAAGNLMGNVSQNQEITYGAGSFVGNVGKGYETVIETPVNSFLGNFGVIGQFGTGVVDIPRQLFYTGQSALIGGENIVRDLPQSPGIAVAGVAMMTKGIEEQAMSNPAQLAGTLVGMYLLGAGVDAASTKLSGLVRSQGEGYIPMKNIGYQPEGRYPLNPVQSESALARSFEEGKLYPAPTRMAEGGTVPYLHGEGGVPVARLPNAGAGETTLWTALESSSRVKGAGVGETFQLETSGGSEVQGMYGAPIAESYFTKAGSGMPQMIGFNLPFRTPTIFSTVTEGVEAVPKGMRVAARNGDYTNINSYIQARSTEVPAGQAYMPLTKAEYEAIIPDNTILEVTGRNYYTKVGGFGENNFFGTRVPIIEMRSVGFEPGEVVNVPKMSAGESYTKAPAINLFYSSLTPMTQASLSYQKSLAYPSRLPMENVPSYISRAGSPNTASSIQGRSELPASVSRSNEPSSLRYSGRPDYSGVSASGASYSQSISSPLSPSSDKSIVGPGYTKPYPPHSPVTPTYSKSPQYSQVTPPHSPTTPPYSPYSPTNPTPPTTPLLPTLPFTNNGMPANPFSKKRRKSFLELFPMGLDMAGSVVPLPFKGPKPKVKMGAKRWSKVIKEPKAKPPKK
jgi:hypothetical protein